MKSSVPGFFSPVTGPGAVAWRLPRAWRRYQLTSKPRPTVSLCACTRSGWLQTPRPATRLKTPPYCCICTVHVTTSPARPRAYAACRSWVFQCWPLTTVVLARARPRCPQRHQRLKTHAPPGTGWRQSTRVVRATFLAIHWVARLRSVWPLTCQTSAAPSWKAPLPRLLMWWRLPNGAGCRCLC